MSAVAGIETEVDRDRSH